MSETSQKQRDWILTTKLNPPLLRSDIVDRPHLLARLERELQRSLTLIAAPAGYGKSTLAAQWLENSSLPGVWISLDEADNDARSFLGYVMAAVRRLDAKACTGIHDLLGAPQLPPSDVLAKLLANDLEKIDEPFLLVLDDYHLVTDPDIHDLLDRLLQHPPRSLHLVILTRRDPPFPLVTMKARGQAVEIRESDLQFDATETGQVLERVGDIHLDEDGLARVMDQVEGWITGLRLFCLAMEKGDDPNLYLFGMTGGAIHVQDYLVEQVLSHQHPELQECLLKTSILERFCAPLCEALCNSSPRKKAAKKGMNGQTFMDTITASKLFGIQLEPSGEWIRYHHLFRELLHSHLQRRWDPKDIASLHRRAAQWFGDRGLVEEALKHAQFAGDPELAARIIEDTRLEALNTDKWPRLGTWLDTLPPGIENTRPHLLISRAYVLMQSMRIAEIPAVLDKVVALEGESPSDPMLAGEMSFFRGILAFFQGEVEDCKQHFDVALCTVPETNLECRAEGEYFSYVVLHLDGQPKLAVQGLRAAIQRNDPRSLHYQTRLRFGLCFVHALAGQWVESARAAEHLADFSRPNGLLYAEAWAVYMRGNACLQMGDWEEADGFLGQAFDRRYIKNRRAAVDALVGHAICLQILGKIDQADERLREAREFAYWTGDPAHLDVVDSCRARIALLRGDLDAAARWLAAFHGKPEGPVKIFFLEIPEATVCRVLVARGTPECLDQAAGRLDSLEADSRRFHHHCQLVPVLILKSLVSFKRSRIQEALEILGEAVGLAWSGHWVLPFIEGGAPAAELLRQLPENPEWGGFVSQTLARFDSCLEPERAQPAQDESFEDLTNRETDVIVLLCERLYDKEIADRLAISPATVKTHLTHIYGKLGVSNRREAARKAKRLGLV